MKYYDEVPVYYIYIIVSITLHMNRIFIASLRCVWLRRVFSSGNNVGYWIINMCSDFLHNIYPKSSTFLEQSARYHEHAWSAWYFCPILANLLSREFLTEVPSKQFHEIPCGRRRFCKCGKTDRTRRMVAFRKFAIAPQNIPSEKTLQYCRIILTTYCLKMKLRLEFIKELL